MEGYLITKGEPNWRKFMELAVKVMRDTVNEQRDDDKVLPLVGAVIYKPDGTVETAYRGELREGDHAEYTLLERKNRENKLDGAILFSTLEPCAPKSRKPPKIGCAERIVNARIKKVWIGIEDPDPTVDHKGIKYLQEHGIEVGMFDSDLQEVIQEANRTFIGQALERAAANEIEKTEVVVLSELENACSETVIGDFSQKALSLYKKTAKIKEEIESASFNRRLTLQGLLKQENGGFTPTGFGLLLFGKEPRNVMPQAGLLGTIHYPNGREEVNDFSGPMVLIPKEVQQWLAIKLPRTINRSQMHRQTQTKPLLELIREGVVNALVHRDYDIKGAKCHLILTTDKIIIKSPGKPMLPITLELMQSFKAPMLSRNPQLHYVFAQMNLAEERGLGMKTLGSLPEKLGLPMPMYSFEDPYLVLTLYLNPNPELNLAVRSTLNGDELAAWKFIATSDSITRAILVENLGFSERKAQRILKKLEDKLLIRRVGRGPSTMYLLTLPR